MVQKPQPNKIQKTPIFLVIALATVGAVGVMGAMMTTATTADAAGTCFFTNGGGFTCPRFNQICPPIGGCLDIGKP